jgi:hypothetical protein
MSLPSSGALSIGQIYQECGGSSASSDQDILRIRDNWWFADMYPSYGINYDDNAGFAYGSAVINTLHPFRNTVDVNVDYDTWYQAWNGYFIDNGQFGFVTIPQYSNNSGIIFINYVCYLQYNCYLSYLYPVDAVPQFSGDYVYSTSFYDYYGKTRYNQYIAL